LVVDELTLCVISHQAEAAVGLDSLAFSSSDLGFKLMSVFIDNNKAG
jgi:hypothetical protein